jgi:hypothetical protein
MLAGPAKVFLKNGVGRHDREKGQIEKKAEALKKRPGMMPSSTIALTSAACFFN